MKGNLQDQTEVTCHFMD